MTRKRRTDGVVFDHQEEDAQPPKKQRIMALLLDSSSTTTTTTSSLRLCPYLGSINRPLLDFDFEKLCSICLSNQHVYCCLVCGKYFQGRGSNTYCYTHSLEESHFVFINLRTCQVYCLPENYFVQDASLDDIRYFLKPTYTPQQVNQLSKTVIYGKALDGTDFIPGCIGLNNLKKTDFFNVIIQVLCAVVPLRNFLLLLDLSAEQSPDVVLNSLGELVRKIFNPKNFKGIVSPHEFLQSVGVASNKRFRIGAHGDPVAFLSWLLHRLHIKLKGTNSVVDDCFRGEVVVRTCQLIEVNGKEEEKEIEDKITPFLFLTIHLPDAPIFKDSLDRNMIPQVPIFDLLQKFDGETMQSGSAGGMSLLRRYSLFTLPKYLVFNINRFSRNNFFLEKNPTIVTFPVKNLDLKDYLHPKAKCPVTRYNLVGNICHEGKPTEGTFKVQVFHAPSGGWYEIEDLRVTQVLPQFVALSEAYLQVYQRQDIRSDGSVDTSMAAVAAASDVGDDSGVKEEEILVMDDEEGVADIFA